MNKPKINHHNMLYENKDIIRYANLIDFNLIDAEGAIEDLVDMGYDEEDIKEALEYVYDNL